MDTKLLPAMFALLFFSAAQTLFAQQNTTQTIDSLEQVLAAGNLSDNELLEIYRIISDEFNHDPPKSVQYARKGLTLAEKTGNRETDLEYYFNLASAYVNLAHYDSAFVYYKKVMEIYQTANVEQKPKVPITTLRRIGDLYAMKGRHEEALDYLHRAAKMAEEKGEKKLLSTVYSGLGRAYFTISNFEQAESYFVKMKNICTETGDTILLSYSLCQLSVIYNKKGEYAKALEYAEDAYDFITRYPNAYPQYVITAVRALATSWRYNNDITKALNYAKEALALTEKYHIRLLKSEILAEIAELYNITGDYAAVEHFALQALETETDVYVRGSLYDLILRANIRLGRANEAIKYLVLHRDWTSNYVQQTFQASLSEMEVKYETEKKELKIAAMEEEKRLLLWLSVAGFILLALGLTTFFSLWRWTIQKKRLAEKQTQWAEQQVKQLEQEKQLIATQAVLDGEVQERTRLARDLHDGLGSILAAAKYNLADFKKVSGQEMVDMERFDKAIGLLDESMREMRRVAHHLMPESLSSSGLKLSIADFCNSIPHVNFNYYGDETRFDPKMEVMIYRIMHELVGNALKHAEASHILVQIVQESNRIALTVEDNGCGFDTSAESEGMGLANIRTRVAAYDGSLLVDSKVGVGTEVSVELRISN